MNTWTIAGPLLGVIVGAVSGGVFSLLVARRTHSDTRAREVAEARRAEYFTALDAVAGMRNALRTIRAATAGRWEPEESDTSAEAAEMRERDDTAWSAIEEIDRITVDLERIVLRIRAVGSVAVANEVERLQARVLDWFVESAASPVFSGQRFQSLDEDVQGIISDITGAVRKDLEVDRIYGSREDRVSRGARTS